jgi:hypothetical protein
MDLQTLFPAWGPIAALVASAILGLWPSGGVKLPSVKGVGGKLASFVPKFFGRTVDPAVTIADAVQELRERAIQRGVPCSVCRKVLDACDGIDADVAELVAMFHPAPEVKGAY